MEIKVTLDETQLKALIKQAVKEALSESGPAPVVDLSTTPITIPGTPEGLPAPKTADDIGQAELRGVAKEFAIANGSKGREALVSLLNDLGARSLSTLDESKYVEFVQRCQPKSQRIAGCPPHPVRGSRDAGVPPRCTSPPSQPVYPTRKT